jgi:DNA-binding Xre family transcriptional regulator
MKDVRSNLLVLAAQKSQREGRRISLRQIVKDTGVSKYTIYALAHNQLEEFPKDVLKKLCDYFDCDIGDLLKFEEVPDTK